MELRHLLPLLLVIAWLLPLASFTAIVLFGPRMGKAGRGAGYVATGAIFLAFVLLGDRSGGLAAAASSGCGGRRDGRRWLKPGLVHVRPRNVRSRVDADRKMDLSPSACKGDSPSYAAACG